MWKRFLCAVRGHRRARLEGCSHPIITYSTTESGLEMRVDYCGRCGVLFGHLKEIDIGEVERVDLLSKDGNR